MFRHVATKVFSTSRQLLNQSTPRQKWAIVTTRFMSHGVEESDEEFVKRYEAYFNRSDIDGWDIRQGLTKLAGDDCVPDPVIIIAALKAIRRVNDYALAIRFLENVEFKTGKLHDTLWPYILQEITPTLKELGIETPKELGYDKPELALESVYHM